MDIIVQSLAQPKLQHALISKKNVRMGHVLLLLRFCFLLTAELAQAQAPLCAGRECEKKRTSKYLAVGHIKWYRSNEG